MPTTPFAMGEAFEIADKGFGSRAAVASQGFQLFAYTESGVGPLLAARLPQFDLLGSPTLGDPSAVGPVGNSNAAIAVLAGGNFVVATSGVAPEARILSISGLVDTIPISAATDLRVAALADGNFVLAWLEAGFVKFQIYEPDGDTVGSVVSFDQGNEIQLEIAALQDGGFVLAFNDTTSGNGDPVYFIRNADGTPRGRGLSSDGGVVESDPFVFGLKNGTNDAGFVSVFTNESGSDGDGDGIYFVLHNADDDGDTPVAIQVNTTTTGNQRNAAGVGLKDGGFVIVWQDGSSSGDIRAQVFNANGSKRGLEFLVAEGANHQAFPSVAETPDGRLVFTWEELFNPNFGVQARIFDPRQGAITMQFGDLDGLVVGTIFADVLRGGSGSGPLSSSFLSGGDGDDLIEAGSGGAYLFGDAGNDILRGSPETDVLKGGSGFDQLIGGKESDVYFLTDALDTIAEASGKAAGIADYIFSEGVDIDLASAAHGGGNVEGAFASGAKGITIKGNALDNILSGGGGVDALFGRKGNDTYAIGAGDTVSEAKNSGSDTVGSIEFSIDLRDFDNIENAYVAGSLALDLVGDTRANTLTGNEGANVIFGARGRDRMTGGGAADVFKFDKAAETGKTAAKRDVITDFAVGVDTIDVAVMDADGPKSRDSFRFLAGNGDPFTGRAGQLRWFKENNPGKDNDRTIVEGDIDGDGVADFQIELTGLKTLTAGDFEL